MSFTEAEFWSFWESAMETDAKKTGYSELREIHSESKKRCKHLLSQIDSHSHNELAGLMEDLVQKLQVYFREKLASVSEDCIDFRTAQIIIKANNSIDYLESLNLEALQGMRMNCFEVQDLSIAVRSWDFDKVRAYVATGFKKEWDCYEERFYDPLRKYKASRFKLSLLAVFGKDVTSTRKEALSTLIKETFRTQDMAYAYFAVMLPKINRVPYSSGLSRNRFDVQDLRELISNLRTGRRGTF